MGKNTIGRARLSCAVALMLLGAGCGTGNPTRAVTETERALCESWGGSLPSRSRLDTERTTAEIGVSYDVFEAACPGFDLTFRLALQESLGPFAGGGV